MGNHPREARPPSRWGRSKCGIYFYLIHTDKRDSQGRKLYRCRYGKGTVGRHFTFKEFEENGVRWLKRRPSSFSDH